MADYDIFIIGGGPGGLTAALYSGRALVRTALIDKMIPGGQMVTTDWIENYPGFDEGVSGAELGQRMEKQARRFGVKFLSGTVTDADLQSNPKKIFTGDKQYTATSVIVSTGTDPRMLNVPGEKEYRGKGVSYCGTCDAPFFKDKDVLVVGGGSTSMQESLHLAKFARSVRLLSRRPRIEELKSERILIQKVQDHPKISLELHKRVLEIKGEQKVNSVVIENLATGEIQTNPIDGVFIFIGVIPNTAFLHGKIKLSEMNEIVTDEEMCSSIRGVFAVGDVRQKSVRQISTAVGDGSIASLSAIHYVEHAKAIEG